MKPLDPPCYVAGMRVLVTGGAGFIGSHLAERLAGAGHEVVVYDVFSKLYPQSVKRRNVASALALPGCSLIEGDLLDDQRLDSVFSPRPFDVVAHLAAWPGAHASLSNPRLFARNNVAATMQLLEQCRQHRTPRFVFASSAAVYGLRREGPLKETDPADRAISPYGATKRAAEMLCHPYHHLHGLSVACLRLFSVFGPRQRPDQSLREFARALASGEPVRLRGDGASVRDLVYVDDAVDALARAVERDAGGFETFNVGSGAGIPVADLARRLAEAMGVECRIEVGGAAPADQPYAVADVAKAARGLSWSPTVAIDDGLRRFAAWFKAEEFEDEA
ncbi:MAG: NAD-dependent epimerase/dehydratase family protein [Myxococcota bacterium]|nr:NAD-dependent epimerase/dehydratase family protein [Myxococcota bacterium]